MYRHTYIHRHTDTHTHTFYILTCIHTDNQIHIHTISTYLHIYIILLGCWLLVAGFPAGKPAFGGQTIYPNGMPLLVWGYCWYSFKLIWRLWSLWSSQEGKTLRRRTRPKAEARGRGGLIDRGARFCWRGCFNVDRFVSSHGDYNPDNEKQELISK